MIKHATSLEKLDVRFAPFPNQWRHVGQNFSQKKLLNLLQKYQIFHGNITTISGYFSRR